MNSSWKRVASRYLNVIQYCPRTVNINILVSKRHWWCLFPDSSVDSIKNELFGILITPLVSLNSSCVNRYM